MGARRIKSKTPSATNSAPPQRERVVFYVDECLGKGVAAALVAAGVRIQPQEGFVRIGAKDADWLAKIGQHQLVVLTKDKAIRRRIAERNALIAARVKAFVLIAGNMTGEEMAGLFIRLIDKIETIASQTPPPFIAGITRNGTIRIYE